MAQERPVKSVAKFLAEIHVSLKPGVQDPVGRTILENLPDMGLRGVSELTTGKYFKVGLDALTEAEAKKLVDKICDQLLANPNIEVYRFDIKKS